MLSRWSASSKNLQKKEDESHYLCIIVHWKYALPHRLAYNFSCLSLKIVKPAFRWRWIFACRLTCRCDLMALPQLYLNRFRSSSGQRRYRLSITLKYGFFSFSGQSKQSKQNTPWVIFSWRNHGRRDTKAKIHLQLWKANFTISVRKNN